MVAPLVESAFPRASKCNPSSSLVQGVMRQKGRATDLHLYPPTQVETRIKGERPEDLLDYICRRKELYVRMLSVQRRQAKRM